MKTLMTRFVVLVAALLTGVADGGVFKASQANRQTQYHVTSLPSLGGTISRGNSVNNRGWVAGALSGDLYSEAHGINERRQVVGVSCSNADGSGNCRAFLWQDGVMTDLNTLVAPGYTNLLTTAQDINDLGVITGRALDPITGERPAFLATPILTRP